MSFFKIPRAIRAPFKPTNEMMTARGFGKRNRFHTDVATARGFGKRDYEGQDFEYSNENGIDSEIF